ncbi:MAG: mechanosensitive ion channel family protein, partial [Acidimicrobiales bacterium]
LGVAMMVLAQAGTQTAEDTAACGPADEASSVCLAVFRATENRFLAVMADTLIVKPAKVLLILVLAYVVNRLIGRAVKRFVKGVKGENIQRRFGSLREHAPSALITTGDNAASGRASKRAETIGDLIRSISGFAVWTVAVLMVLSELGLNLGPLIAGAGIVGVALGFGAQNLVRDFISGIFMLAEDQYGVGDVIDVGPATGRVEGVSLRTTRLRDLNGTVWHVPNGEIQRVGNKSQQWARAVVDVDVAYDTDIKRATGVIKATADAMWRDETSPSMMIEEPEVLGVENLGADGIAIRLMVKTAPDAQLAVARELRARIKRAFDAEGIEIPFPQRTVWHRVDEGTTVVPAAMAVTGAGRSDTSDEGG